MTGLTLDAARPEECPYFFWDEPLTNAALRSALAGNRGESERLRVLGKMLREARDVDVWSYVTPHEVAEALPQVARRLGRRLAFWAFLIEGWRRDGLLSR
jgi:hypothetical protein